jgi:endonuclease/exonuclease/phosphatase family metal-dependent hydrolase
MTVVSLLLKNLIMVGDFNLLLSPEEAWGGNRTGLVDGYYSDLFSYKSSFDIKPAKLVPTWRNGRQGQEAISRRLDRCLVAETLLSEVGFYRSWVELPFVSDHAPVLLQLELRLPIKFFLLNLMNIGFVQRILQPLWKEYGKTRFIF